MAPTWSIIWRNRLSTRSPSATKSTSSTLFGKNPASFPAEPAKLYVNDRPASLYGNHYESPIKFRNASVTSNSENDLVTPTNERPQSYIDMQGKKPSNTEDLLVFANGNNKEEEGN